MGQTITRVRRRAGFLRVARVTRKSDAFAHAMMAEDVEKEKLFERAAEAHSAHVANEQVAG